MLVLQLWGRDQAGKPAYEALFSGLLVQLDKPYYVAISVNLADPSEAGITFYAKDLSNDEEPVQTYPSAHKMVAMPGPHGTFRIGGAPGKTVHSWARSSNSLESGW